MNNTIEINPYTILYMPPKFHPVNGAVQIVHDMGEHIGRYQAFAQMLSRDGYTVIMSDLKGHGKNITREADLGFFGDRGAANLVSALHENTRIIRDRFPKVPYFMIGQGMGSLLLMSYFKKYDYFLSGMILCGTHPEISQASDRLVCRIGYYLKGEYYRSSHFYKKYYKSYTRGFGREGSPSAWLTQNNKINTAYDRDPLCGFRYTLNGYKTYMDIQQDAYINGSWIQKNPHMPIRIVSGEKDSYCGSRRKLAKIAALYEGKGYDNVDTNLFPEMRHDLFNDNGNEAFYEYVVRTFDKEVRKNQE